MLHFLHKVTSKVNKKVIFNFFIKYSLPGCQIYPDIKVVTTNGSDDPNWMYGQLGQELEHKKAPTEGAAAEVAATAAEVAATATEVAVTIAVELVAAAEVTIFF